MTGSVSCFIRLMRLHQQSSVVTATKPESTTEAVGVHERPPHKTSACGGQGVLMSARYLIPFSECAELLSIPLKTARNWLTAGTFPIPTHRVGGKRMVKMSDVSSFVDKLGSPASNTEVSQRTTPARGRPRNSSKPLTSVKSPSRTFDGKSSGG